MKVEALGIPDVLLFEPEIFCDERGFFFEKFRCDVFEKLSGLQRSFVQENYSFSYRGVLRGLHYQLYPHAQGKLFSVVQGKVFDVAIDLRKSSPTCGQWVAAILSAENKKELWIPEGFAHGFLALVDSVCMYKATAYYNQASERAIHWNDASLKIQWPEIRIVSSLKDSRAQSFVEAQLFD